MERHNKDVGTKEDLMLYRIRTAKENLRSARILLDAQEYKGANNRAYYAIFQAINAVHAIDGTAYKRHKDAIANFNKNYIKQRCFHEKQEERSVKLKKYDMLVIMMIFILQAKKKLKGRYQWQMSLFN